MRDLISRQEAIDAFDGHFAIVGRNSAERFKMYIEAVINDIRKLPPAQLGTNLAEVGTDCISRQQAIDKFIDGLEEIFADLRERHVDDSVCGLCEYDGAYVGQSGEWCNECPGFDRDDCFKLSDKTRKEWTEEIIKALTPIQPDNNSEKPNSSDTISRQAAIDAVTDELDMIDHVPQWVFDRLEGRLKQLPPVAPKQPDCAKCKSELANKIRGQQDNPGMLTENDKGRNWGLEWAAQIVEGKRR